MLWKIDFFVEGKDLEKVFSAVAGYALNMQPPRPVENAGIQLAKGKKQIVAVSDTRLRGRAALAELLSTNYKDGDMVTWSNCRKLLIDNNIPHTGVSSMIIGLKESGMLKATKKEGTYTFHLPKAKA